jgi:hypothetical protein
MKAINGKDMFDSMVSLHQTMTRLREMAGKLTMKSKILWKIDVLIYRLFYWRWSPRLKADPDLAYMFSKIGAAWTNANPPRHRKAVDQMICDEFTKQGKVIPTDATDAGFYLTVQ